ncbi:MAG TPA: hypothetical protein VN619_08165 [Lacisediminihabitans sp.]|nr:hypothetical protein [Lacisediminihabitans sp.]HXD61884.1 hypothetical protein [Lacisediminihabitans sp.]
MDDDKRSMEQEKDRAKQQAADTSQDAGTEEDTASGGAPEEPDK